MEQEHLHWPIANRVQNIIVPNVTCPGDLNNQYIGETERQILVRIKEHVTQTNRAVFNYIYNTNEIYIIKTAVHIQSYD